MNFSGPGGQESPVQQVGLEKRAPERLKKRADFLAAAKGRRQHQRGFVLQACARRSDAEPPRVGFTVTKKIGNAVVRNRIRRRLREAIRLARGLCTADGHDYVMVARKEALAMPFAELAGEIDRAFAKIHASKSR